jgi:hypothetical protein
MAAMLAVSNLESRSQLSNPLLSARAGRRQRPSAVPMTEEDYDRWQDDGDDDDGDDEYERYRPDTIRAAAKGEVDAIAVREGDGDGAGKGRYADIGGWVEMTYELDESDIEESWDEPTDVYDHDLDLEPTTVFER